MYNAIFKCVITIKFTSFKYSYKGFSGLNRTKSPVIAIITRLFCILRSNAIQFFCINFNGL